MGVAVEAISISEAKGTPATRWISVVIPTFNRADLLVEAVQSVLAQRGLPPGVRVEIIVVDDGSTDDTLLRMQAYAPGVTCLALGNGGVARARNQGARVSRGDLLCFLDSDDLWLPDKLARQLAAMDREREAALFATEILPFDGERVQPGRSKSALYKIEDGWAVERLLFGNWIQTSTVMVRRSAFEAASGFDEDVGQFGEDWLLWMRIAAAHPVRFLPEPLVRYRLHPASLTSHEPESQFTSLMMIFDRLAGLPQFVRRPSLIAKARYRVCVGRASRDLACGEPARAHAKLRLACGLRRLPVRALLLLCRAALRTRLGRVRSAGASA